MKNLKQYLNHIFIDGLSGMALGLFSTLIIGTILQQIGNLIDGSIGTTIFLIGKISAAATCAGIGVGVAYKFKETPLVVISAAVSGMVGGFATKILAGSIMSDTGVITLSGPGEPLGAFIAAVVGCCCQMVGFAVASYRENKFGGLLAQGIGTSMLQIPNIIKKPVIWLPAIISSAILGPISSTFLKMTNNATGSGMGSAGFVGQIMAYQTMTQTASSKIVMLQIIVIHFVLPALLTFIISEFMRKKEWIKQGDMALDL